jgi:acyl-CoA synthetase (AMP-forming)/AMP-acid ligase II
MVVAVVVPKGQSAEDIDEETIMTCCKEQLAGYKRPKRVVFIRDEDMPRTPTGKILHRVLRERLKEKK